MVDWLAAAAPAGMFRLRGVEPSVSEGMVMYCADDILANVQFLELLAADEVPPASALDKLPAPEVAAKLGTCCALGSTVVSTFIGASSMLGAMLAHERLGSADGALAFAAIILESNMAQSGGGSSRARSLAHACRGRVLASMQGKMEAAEEAFEAAQEVAEAGQNHLLTATALRDLRKHVLDGAGRGDEGKERLEEAVSRLACSAADLETFNA